jgi:F-type H+-transporting ATPase subunit epsilon
MDNTTIVTKIITPSNILLEQESEIVSIPGEEGYFAVLPNHAPLIANLQPGIIIITYLSQIYKYFIYSGIVQVTVSNVNIITEFAINCSNFDKDIISKKLLELEQKLSNSNNEDSSNSISTEILRYQELQKHIDL